MAAVWHALRGKEPGSGTACTIIRRVHRVLSVISTALITAGVVVLADVGITLAWEEPVSSIYGEIQQQRAEGELDDLEQSFLDRSLPDVGGLTGLKAARKLADAFEDDLETGNGIGRIDAPGMGLEAVIVEGTDTSTLQKGPGRYPETALPGQGKTIGIAGHRTTYLASFREIDEIEAGEEITVEMPYARFTYVVSNAKIVEPSQTGVLGNVGGERLVLTTCHPEYSAAERYVLVARLTEVAQSEP
jgi:sortase A